MNINNDDLCNELKCDLQKYSFDTYCSISKTNADKCKIFHYTHGQCVAFAIALHETSRCRYPLYAIFHCESIAMTSDEIIDKSLCPEKRTILHAFCMTTDDKYTVIDARGVKQLDYIFRFYRDNIPEKDISVVDFQKKYVVKIPEYELIKYSRTDVSTTNRAIDKEEVIKDAIDFIEKHPKRYKIH